MKIASSDFFEISKTGWFFQSELLEIYPELSDSLKILRTSGSLKNQRTVQHILFCFVCFWVCVCGGGKGERNVTLLLVLLRVKTLPWHI
jgi:hypothetical protein